MPAHPGPVWSMLSFAHRRDRDGRGHRCGPSASAGALGPQQPGDKWGGPRSSRGWITSRRRHAGPSSGAPERRPDRVSRTRARSLWNSAADGIRVFGSFDMASAMSSSSAGGTSLRLDATRGVGWVATFTARVIKSGARYRAAPVGGSKSTTPGAINVRAGIGGVPAQPFRRHVGWRAGSRGHDLVRAARRCARIARCHPRDAEVEQLDLAVTGEHHVCRLDVAMHDTRVVGVTERLGVSCRPRSRAARSIGTGWGSGDQRGERSPRRRTPSRGTPRVRARTNVVDRGDVAVVQAGRSARASRVQSLVGLSVPDASVEGL